MRIVIAEDLFLLRDGLERTLVDHGHDVVASVDNGPALRIALSTLDPDVAIVDVRLPPTFTDEGLKIAIDARRDRPGQPVLVLSQYVEELYARELLADGSGAIGYLLKDRVSNNAQFLDAIKTVAGGGTVMDPSVITKLLRRGEVKGRTSTLTSREREVLAAMAAGRSNASIGEVLHLSTSAVTKHINSIFTKLDLPASEDDNRRVLAVLAYLEH